MFGIGAFGRLAQVSVRTLHYYDQQGLLRPAKIDPGTGYRWYVADQLHRLNRILALRDLGLSLAEIQRVVDDDVTLDELRGMLRLRRAEAQDRMALEAERLARVEARLRQIELEHRVGDYDVVVKSLEPLQVAVLHENAPSFGDETLGPILGRLYDELHAALANAGVSPIGPAMALYADSTDDDAPIKVMAGRPIRPTEVKPSGRIEVLDLPAVTRAATTVHRGSMSRVEEGYQALMHWSEETGERIEGYSREVYLDCGGEPDTWITELQFALCTGRLALPGEGPQVPKEERDRHAKNI